ncbi:MAG: diaminopimelate decarboxylase [Kordiimonas sp.]|nr:diaminopimelate decarboxylase [Kordiimonas sp.]
MDHFQYKNGELHAEDVPISEIAAAVGTPFYCYSTATLERHYKVFAEAFTGQNALVCYAVKANTNQAVIRTLARLGCGADVVSQGELRRALAAGVPAEKIVYSGVAKTEEEMAFALTSGIHQFNVESEAELEQLSRVASDMGKVAPVAFRLNPDVDAKTHEKIATGKAENKFGISWKKAQDVYAQAAALPGIEVVGVDVHIGSQLTELGPFMAAFERVAGLVKELRAAGHNIRRLDLGGGLGVPYMRTNAVPPHPVEYAQMIKAVTGDLGCQIILEPGRLIVGNAGVMISKVVYVKDGEKNRFVIIDGAMNDLLRPSLYDAWHDILPVREASADVALNPVDIVGPVCETGDVFAKGREMPPLKMGDLVSLMTAGAYGAVMASTYNTRPLVPEVLVKNDQFQVIRQRPSYEDMIGLDIIPEWLD